MPFLLTFAFNSMNRALRLTAFCISLLQSIAQAQSPRLLPFQGRLTDSTGAAIPDGPKLIQFQIFGESTGGTPQWAGEVHRATVNAGLVNVILGSKNSLPF